MLHYPPPTAFGLPEKFQSCSPEQLQAIERSSRAGHRFVCHSLPTGSGKSLVGMAPRGWLSHHRLTVEVLDGNTSQPGGYSSERRTDRWLSYVARHSIKAVRRCR